MAISLSQQYKNLNVAGKLIVINVVVYFLTNIIPFLFRFSASTVTDYLAVPDDVMQFITQPWSLVTYSFLHGGFWHIAFNMLWIYFLSRIFLNFFDEKRLLVVYFMGVVVGALTFIVAYNLFPAFAGTNANLVGASAGVTALMIFLAAYMPNFEVRVFMFTLKLWWIGAFFVLKDLLQLPYGNAGGLIAHLGGALIGYLYATQLEQGRDIGSAFAKAITYIENLFKPKDTRRRSSMKTVHKKKGSFKNAPLAKTDKQQRIDLILDKINKSGYESLSQAEKDFLFKAND